MSANKGPWINNLLKNGYSHKDGGKDLGYSQVDGHSLGEKNPKWLQDDYVKFIRFAQWKMDTAGEGVIGFITITAISITLLLGGCDSLYLIALIESNALFLRKRLL